MLLVMKQFFLRWTAEVAGALLLCLISTPRLLDSAIILLLDSATARPALLSLLSLSRAGPSPRPKHNRRPAPNRFYQLSDPVK